MRLPERSDQFVHRHHERANRYRLGQITFGTGIANLLWIVFAGIWLWISHVLAGIAYCVTIIGIPFGFAHFRLAAVSFAPLGKRAIDLP